jgi:hypothetical protein
LPSPPIASSIFFLRAIGAAAFRRSHPGEEREALSSAETVSDEQFSRAVPPTARYCERPTYTGLHETRNASSGYNRGAVYVPDDWRRRQRIA